jgi:hypothetical protein
VSDAYDAKLWLARTAARGGVDGARAASERLLGVVARCRFRRFLMVPGTGVDAVFSLRTKRICEGRVGIGGLCSLIRFVR